MTATKVTGAHVAAAAGVTAAREGWHCEKRDQQHNAA
jgi:hypothetical protein